MITVPFLSNDYSGTQISLIGSVSPGTESYIAVDDIELIDYPCFKVEHEKEFSCLDSFGEKLPYSKVCDFVYDCKSLEDEKDCAYCSFEKSMCRFVDVSQGNGWERQKADSNVTTGPMSGAHGFFLHLPFGQYRIGNFETSNTFAMSSRHCKLQFKLYLSKGSSLRIYIKTHMETFEYENIVEPADWDLITVHIGGINVPFLVHFKGDIDLGTTGIGIDEIEMFDCVLHRAQDKCLRDEFQCDNKACTDDYTVCDIRNDCGDFSDEKNCEEFIQDDFEYSLGSWTTEQAKDEGLWRLTLAQSSYLKMDHTEASVAGKYLQCSAPTSYSNVALCHIASPVLTATDNNSSKACEIRFFYANRGVQDNEVGVFMRAIGSTDFEGVSFTETQEGKWYRVRAALSKNNDFQIVLTGVLRNTDDDNFLALDDISLTDGCKLKNDVISTKLTTEASINLKPHTPPSATFVESTESSVSTKVTPSKNDDSHTTTQDVNLKEKTDPSHNKYTSGRDTTIALTTTPTAPQKEKKDTKIALTTTPIAPQKDKKDTKITRTTTPRTSHKEKADLSHDKETSGKDTKDTHTGSKKKPGASDGEATRGQDKQSSPKKSSDSWQIPVGITFGVVGVLLIAVLVIIYLKRTNRLFSHIGSHVGYVNEMYVQEEEEMKETNYGSHEMMPDIFENTTQGNGMSLENPSYEEFEG
ncbi:MAM and LDL-receptor class A domain-containing protein 1-like [Elysia marginata]|uniref:MAM and LDL-receptor class A domain-containing protein 1-like n=1 Tax=Elysia marginata TaxID=1093978 RepID=A0AAV4H190_9GAST|nr:MAM and LDL-receptor class A domain-containing protein 1-like [Elysia marginata]